MSNDKKIEWLLRVGVFGEFLGHGILAVGGKADWVKWIGNMIHVDVATATTLLLLIGIADILLAVIVLLRPVPKLLVWMAIWGFWTALIRPIMGVGWPDFIERSANWAAPLALFYLYRSRK